MVRLESIEWTDMWLDHPADKEKKRALLIGDSITRGFLHFVKAEVGENVLVDAVATSRAVDNEAFETEIFYVMNNAEYDVIHFNNGLHGFHLSAEDYEKYYEKTVKRIINENPKSKIILGLSTPITESGDTSTLSPKNKTVEERNEAVLRIAKRLNLPTNDNYSVILGNSAVRGDDGYHYTQEGYKILAQNTAKYL